MPRIARIAVALALGVASAAAWGQLEKRDVHIAVGGKKGHLIHQAEGVFDINTVFAGILVLTAFALVLDAVVTLVEKRLMVWQPRSGETERI